MGAHRDFLRKRIPWYDSARMLPKMADVTKDGGNVWTGG